MSSEVSTGKTATIAELQIIRLKNLNKDLNINLAELRDFEVRLIGMPFETKSPMVKEAGGELRDPDRLPFTETLLKELEIYEAYVERLTEMVTRLSKFI